MYKDMLNVIILAGEQSESKWNDRENKALLRMNGKAMIEYVIDAFREVEEIDKIVVVGCKDELEALLKDKVNAVLHSKGSIMDNVVLGVNHLGMDRPVLLSTCDIPMITAQAIFDFIKKAEASNADFCYPIVEKAVNDSKYPEFERTYAKLREGTFTGGNIFYFKPDIINKGYSYANKLIEARKNPLKMASVVSPGFLAQFALGRLSIDMIERKFSSIMGFKVKAVISDFAEIGNDVDKPSDVIIATAHLSQ